MFTYYYHHFKLVLALLFLLLNLPLITSAQMTKPNVIFEEVEPKTSGITWVHNNAHSTDRYLPETVGAGCAFFDYDNDGWMDIYLVNSGPSDFYNPGTPLKNALYHNNHDGTFTDVSDKAGVAGGTFGMGVAAGDYDGDGWVDLYITSYGRNILYHNNGNGTFTDVTDRAGVAAPGWSTCAVWFDYDNDGKLDLFVSSFVVYERSLNILCTDEGLSRRYYCVPRLFKPRPSHLFHNNGNGTFTDVSKESGIADSPGKSFGAVATDVNNDGRMDLFVANDTMPNFLFINKGGGKFEEVGLAAGVAFSDMGKPRSGMGVDAADYDGDGWQDLFVGNIDKEFFSLYHNQKDLIFTDEPGEIGTATQMLSGWGLRFFDFDNDGDLDVLISNNGEAPLLLRNQGGNKNNWLGLQLIATRSNPAAVGAVITWQAGAVKRSRLKTAGGSYLSSHDPRELLGLGTARKIDSVEIRWPSGKVDKLTNLPINTYLKVIEGEGVAKNNLTAAK